MNMTAHGKAVKEIGGISYEISYLTGSESLRVFSRIARLIGPCIASFSSLAKETDSGGLISDILKHRKFKTAWTEAVNNLSANLNEDEIVSLAATLLKAVRRSDLPTQAISLDNDFRGRTKDMLILLKRLFPIIFRMFFPQVATQKIRSKNRFQRR